MKAVVICRADNDGAPDIGTGWHRWAHVGDLPGAYAIYIVVASGVQLTAIEAMPGVVGGAVVSNGSVRWSQLDEPLQPALRTKLNTWLTNRGLPTVGSNFTLLQLVRRAASEFDYGTHDVWDGA